jgi:ribonuclease E
MLEPDNSDTTGNTPASDQAPVQAPRKRAAKKAGPVTEVTTDGDPAAAPRKRAAKRTPAPAATGEPAEPIGGAAPPAKRTRRTVAAKAVQPVDSASGSTQELAAAPAKAARKRAARKPPATDPVDSGEPVQPGEPGAAARAGAAAPVLTAPSVLFVPPGEATAPTRPRRGTRAPAGPPRTASVEPAPAEADITVAEAAEDQTAEPDDVREAAVEEATGARRRRRRGRRGRGGTARDADDSREDDTADPDVAAGDDAADPIDGAPNAEADDAEDGAKTTVTRRRRRRRAGGAAGLENADDDPPNTVVHVRQLREKGDRADRSDDDGVKGVRGSTRLEAKRQRRRDGRDTGRRPAILTESEFLARRESVDRVMAVRQHGDRTQIAVLEDDILVEHYVTRASATSYVGNVYLGRVQNVLPSMEAAFVDIGKGRNGVLYAGEVNWDAAGLEGKSRAIEHALKSGDVVLVQVTKDPIGHKGARLTSQVSLPGRFLVYVPGGGMTGISRKLPDTERHRLKSIMKKIVPEDAGVIIRTAAEGASEQDLTHDVERLKTQWEKIAAKAKNTKSAPMLVHGEPDLAIRVVRDVFNEDFKKLVVQGDEAWQTVSDYIEGVAPDLAERSSRHPADTDLFHALRVDEQLMKALDRKVYLPSGGSLVIDRTEAMTVIDVNTGKFVGAGGNLEQTVTRNNIEAAEEIVRQLRLRDVGGMIVIDFIDMVLESNRDLVLRRLTECLGRDRTKHQVAEVTSLGLVQMTRKRVGEGLLEAFSEQCPTCNGRGVLLHAEPVDQAPPSSEDGPDEHRPKAKRKRGGAKKGTESVELELEEHREQRLAAIAAIHRATHPDEHGAPDQAEPQSADPDGLVVVLDAELGDAESIGAELADTEPVVARPADSAVVGADVLDGGVPEADALDAGGTEPDVPDADLAAGFRNAGAVAADVPDADLGAGFRNAGPVAEMHESTAVRRGAAEIAPAETTDEIEADHAEPQRRPASRRRRAASRPAGPPVAVS